MATRAQLLRGDAPAGPLASGASGTIGLQLGG